MELTCKRCGCIGDPIIQEGLHRTANCSSCGSYIKHLPKDRSKQTDFELYKGKYKGVKVSEMNASEELDYLKWAVKTEGFFKPWEKEIVVNRLK